MNTKTNNKNVVSNFFNFNLYDFLYKSVKKINKKGRSSRLTPYKLKPTFGGINKPIERK